MIASWLGLCVEHFWRALWLCFPTWHNFWTFRSPGIWPNLSHQAHWMLLSSEWLFWILCIKPGQLRHHGAIRRITITVSGCTTLPRWVSLKDIDMGEAMKKQHSKNVVFLSKRSCENEATSKKSELSNFALKLRANIMGQASPKHLRNFCQHSEHANFAPLTQPIFS